MTPAPRHARISNPQVSHSVIIQADDLPCTVPVGKEVAIVSPFGCDTDRTARSEAA
jgi:hypothetical protein